MDRSFPPRYPVLVSSSSLDALIYASLPQDLAIHNHTCTCTSPSSPSQLSPPNPPCPNMGLKDTIFSRLDSSTPPPVPPKDWTPPGSPSRSANISAHTSPRNSPGTTRRKTSKRKPKRSLGLGLLDFSIPGATATNSDEFLSPSLSVSSLPLATPPLGTPDLLPDLPAPLPRHPDLLDESEDDDGDTRSWYDMNCVVRRGGTIPHHPFRQDFVPYMQAYSEAAFANDEATFELLKKVSPPGSPTFWDYGSRPPATVLDLGSGKGYWAVDAATTWKFAGTKVTAFDLIDLGRPLREQLDPEIAENMYWVRGNFLLRKLPFKDNSFELVRMANLHLAVPHHAWYPLIQEVHRVLKPGGRIELIDDQLFFPKIQYPFDWIDDPRKASRRNARVMEDPLQLNFLPGSTRVPSDLLSSASSKPVPAPVAEFRESVDNAKYLEAQFERMLVEKYGIYPRPHKVISEIFDSVFGSTNYHRLLDMQVAVPVAPEEPAEKPTGRRSTDDDRSRILGLGITIEWDKKDRPALQRATSSRTNIPRIPRPQGMSSKAERVLVGNRSMDYRKLPPYQAEGIIILPSTFIPCQPDVLEMHACRHMNTLLACSYALRSFLLEEARKLNEAHKTHVSFDESMFDDTFKDMMSDYESFKRRRMNWPRDLPGVMFEEDEPVESSFNIPFLGSPLFSKDSGSSRPNFFGRHRAHSMSGEPLFKRVEGQADDVIVRTFRVFSARKPVHAKGANV
ncbi:unnamed protein product [Somion occarium]|uniref:Methyltransferase domain-containing protein n=1 Tax=Somion occarium TaxID=3059160 RepID=A0ABP1CFK8_9APHY